MVFGLSGLFPPNGAIQRDHRIAPKKCPKQNSGVRNSSWFAKIISIVIQPFFQQNPANLPQYSKYNTKPPHTHRNSETCKIKNPKKSSSIKGAWCRGEVEAETAFIDGDTDE